jgi:hypothetical protein
LQPIQLPVSTGQGTVAIFDLLVKTLYPILVHDRGVGKAIFRFLERFSVRSRR